MLVIKYSGTSMEAYLYMETRDAYMNIMYQQER